MITNCLSLKILDVYFLIREVVWKWHQLKTATCFINISSDLNKSDKLFIIHQQISIKPYHIHNHGGRCFWISGLVFLGWLILNYVSIVRFSLASSMQKYLKLGLMLLVCIVNCKLLYCFENIWNSYIQPYQHSTWLFLKSEVVLFYIDWIIFTNGFRCKNEISLRWPFLNNTSNIIILSVELLHLMDVFKGWKGAGNGPRNELKKRLGGFFNL